MFRNDVIMNSYPSFYLFFDILRHHQQQQHF